VDVAAVAVAEPVLAVALTAKKRYPPHPKAKHKKTKG
jgi:hypothetical protein